MKRIFEQHKLTFTLLLFLITSIVSIYITGLNGHIWSFLGMNNDGRFHIMRMEGLYESIKQGNIFPAVNMSMLNGLGYISNLFYSNLWLYPVALLRLAGLSMVQAFVIFYIVINFCTFLTSFWSYYKISQRYDKSLLFSFIYTLATYRIFDMVRRFDIGETLTLVFLPIVLLGIYEIFYGDDKKWLYLTLGMSAVIYSHALSPILIAIFIIFVILFRIKTLIKQPQRIKALLYAGVTSLGLTLAYFLPMFEQLKHTQFKLTNSPLLYVSQTMMKPKDIFHLSMISDLYLQNIGLVMMLVAIIIPFTIWKVKNTAVRDFAIIGEILLFMTTDLFPWKLFDKTTLNMIQFPWRFFMIITILFSIYLAYDPIHLFNKSWKKILLGLAIVGLTLNSEQVLVQTHPYENDKYSQFNDLDVYSIGGGEEYLPEKASYAALREEPHTPQVLAGTVKISNFYQKGSKVVFDFNQAKQAKIDLPIIGYYGYSSKDSTGKVSKLTMDTKNNGLGQVTVNGKGKVKVDYYKTPIQRLSKDFSIFVLLILILKVVRRKFLK